MAVLLLVSMMSLLVAFGGELRNKSCACILYAAFALASRVLCIVQGIRVAMAADAARSAHEDVGKSHGKQLVGNYSLRGLAMAWDNTEKVRSRLRAHSRVLLHYDPKLKLEQVVSVVEKTVYNLRANHFVLSPVLNLVRTHQQLLPSIDRLIEELWQLYALHNLKPAADTVYHEAWTLRQLSSLLKGEYCRLIAEFKKGGRQEMQGPFYKGQCMFSIY